MERPESRPLYWEGYTLLTYAPHYLDTPRLHLHVISKLIQLWFLG